MLQYPAVLGHSPDHTPDSGSRTTSYFGHQRVQEVDENRRELVISASGRVRRFLSVPLDAGAEPSHV